MGAHQQRLRVGIADAADPARSGKISEILIKSGAEGGVRDGMDLPVKSRFLIPDRHACIFGAQMAVIVRAEKDVHNDVAPGDGAEEAPHQAKKSSESVMGSMYLPSL